MHHADRNAHAALVAQAIARRDNLRAVAYRAPAYRRAGWIARALRALRSALA